MFVGSLEDSDFMSHSLPLGHGFYAIDLALVPGGFGDGVWMPL